MNKSNLALAMVIFLFTNLCFGHSTKRHNNYLTPRASACVVWSETGQYTAGQVVTYNGQNYTALVTFTSYPGTGWTPANTPTLWRLGGSCGTVSPCPVCPVCPNQPTPKPSPKPSPLPSNTPTSPPIPITSSFVISPYKDLGINMNWNTYVISSNVTGSPQNMLNVFPSGLNTLTWAFATGECGSESWGGISPSQVASNVAPWVAAGKKYIISTGGADGAFTCGSDAGFNTFIQTYYSANMVGIDFDIEGSQSASQISNLIQRVIVAQAKYPHLRFSFTLATLGGNSAQSLGGSGVTVMQSIQTLGLKSYYINLMTMDYGSPNPTVCTVSNGVCDMGASAINAAKNLNSYWKVPYSQMEITPMIGGNDSPNEIFSINNSQSVATFILQNKLAGLHFWSLDRDNDCPLGAAIATCNSYGTAGSLGFTKSFINSGL